MQGAYSLEQDGAPPNSLGVGIDGVCVGHAGLWETASAELFVPQLLPVS